MKKHLIANFQTQQLTNFMYFIRPIASSDLDALHQVVHDTGKGFTSLQGGLQNLQSKIKASQQAFDSPDEHEDQFYFFVLEESESQKVVGISGILSKVGINEPHYSYRLSTITHASKVLNVFSQKHVLFLTNDKSHCSEICSLALLKNHRGKGNGTLLSKHRFLFMTNHQNRFASSVFAEMRGFFNEQHQSPFWESLGQKFFQIDFAKADALTGLAGSSPEHTKAFIAELMPHHPIYIDFLTEEARAVIGQTHHDTMPARYLLEKEGFLWNGYIDIFDAGPTLECPMPDIYTIKRSQLCQVKVQEDKPSEGRKSFLVSNTKLKGYRAISVLTTVERRLQKSQYFNLTPKQAELLQVAEHELVCVSPI